MNHHVSVQHSTKLELRFEDNRLAASLYGDLERNLKTIEKKVGLTIASRGNLVALLGKPSAVECAKRVLESLYAMVEEGRDLRDGDVECAINMIRDGAAETGRPKARLTLARIATRKTHVAARTPAQDVYMKALVSNELTFGVGPAGTGKTYLAVAHAAAMLERGDIKRIILSRPAVEAGEKLGFLPGDLKEKVDPYLRPLYDALYDMLRPEDVDRHIASGAIEVAPLAFMRGRTLANAVVILDEAQNTTSMQMKMFLTRLGENASMIVTGDPTQVDLPRGETSGLVEAVRLLDGVEGVGVCRFADKDVVRHALVGRIVRAYEADRD